MATYALYKFNLSTGSGHLFNDGGKLAKHFNAGTWSGTLNDIHFYGNGIHFWYT